MIRCDLCPHHCVLKGGQTGFCHQRMNKEGSIVLKDYGAITSLSLDPIEKKPLYHFYPNIKILSVGSYGCNMKCPFCQNYTISQDKGSSVQVHTTSEKLVEVALDLKKEGNIGIAFTYNEPLISYEFICETFVLCKKHELKTVIVSNGMIEEKYIKELSPLVDAWNIDLKGFKEDIYKKLSGDLNTVKKSIYHASTSHLEVTSLIVPGINDNLKDMEEEAKWLASIDPNIVLHITRYFPEYHYHESPTSIELIDQMVEVAKKYLKNVYRGNC